MKIKMELEHPKRITLEDKEIFDDVVKAILSVLGDDAVKIILYGSVARGDNTWESDVDIAVLTKRQLNWRKEDDLDRAFTPIDLKHETLFSIITIDEKRFNEWLFTLPFYLNIDKEGIILWTKEAA